MALNNDESKKIKSGEEMLSETDKIIYRKIQLLKALDSSNAYLKSTELANLLDLSLKTVQKELSSLAQELKNSGYGVELERVGNSYRFSKKSTINMDLIYLYLKKESIYFYLMKTAIFRKNSQEKEEITYFYSSSHLYKNKRLFKEYLAKYGLELDLATLAIEGSEIKIRFLYFHFFWENYRGVGWPFDTVNRQELIQEIEQIDTQLFKLMTEIEKEQFLYWIAVIKIRESNQQLLTEDQFKVDQIPFKDSEEFQRILAKLLPTNERNILQIEGSYLYFVFTLTTESPLLKGQLLADLEKEQKNFNLHKIVLNLMILFSQKFSLNNRINQVDVYFSIYKLFIYEICYHGLFRKYEIDSRLDRASIQHYEKEFQLFYSEIMSQYGNKYTENKYLYQRVLFLFSTLIEETSYRPQINIKILFSGGAVEEQLLTKKVESLANNIRIKNSSAKDLDIIVSDYMIKNNKDELVFYWNSQPTEKEWQALIKKIAEIEQQKELN